MVSTQSWCFPELLLWLDYPAVEAGPPQPLIRLHLHPRSCMWNQVVPKVGHSVRSHQWGTAGDLGPEFLHVSQTERMICDCSLSHPVCPSDIVCLPYTHLSISLDPVIVQPAAPSMKMRSLLFATQTDCVLVGGSDGQVTVYQLKNLSVGESSQVTLRDNWETV